MDEMDRFDSDDNSDMSQEEAEVLEAFEQLDYEQNLPMGVVAGLIGALVGAALWAWITVLTDAQIGWMAIAVGFLVGLAVRIFGKGLDKVFGIVGAVLSLLGCVAGNVFVICGVVASGEEVGFFEVLKNTAFIKEAFQVSFHLMDLLFYGIAAYMGYKMSFRRLTMEELGKRLNVSPDGV